MQKNYKCSLCDERDYRFNLFSPCRCQANNKKNEDSGFVHRHCLEDLIQEHKDDLEIGETPVCQVCKAPYDINITSSFHVQLSSLFSCQSLLKVVEMIFFLIFLLFFVVIISSMYYDLSHHPIVVIGFICCCVRMISNMYDSILVKIYNSWIFVNSIISVQKPN